MNPAEPAPTPAPVGATGTLAASQSSRLSRKLLRLHAEPHRPGPWGWILPALITLFAGILRVRDLATPHLLMFDETYYAKDAYALLLTGYELVWPEDADDAWLAGEPQPIGDGGYVVHPPLGKWLIALGLRAFGQDTAFGWRISAAVAGTLAVLLIALIAQRMFRSVFLGAFAGMLTAIEGHHLVMSRVALLDIFMMLFCLAAFGALLADRYSGRRRLVAWAISRESSARQASVPARQASVPARQASVPARQPGGTTGDPSHRPSGGPWLGIRPWRLLAGVLLGAAVAVKLSALAFLAVFGIMVLLWDLQARRLAGVERWARSGLFRDALPAMITVLPVAAGTYLASWTGWLASQGGWGRQWHLAHPAEGLARLIPDPIRSLWNYHASAADFHQGLSSTHEYASSPWSWPFMGRPVLMHYDSVSAGEVYAQTGERCAVETCSSTVLDLANPLIWWTGLVALVLVTLLWVGRRDWRHGAILSGVVAGYLVWLLFPDRTTFFFYTISYHPFLILALTATAAQVLGLGTAALNPDGTVRSAATIVAARQRNTVIVLCFVMLCVAVSVFFLPIWTSEMIPYEQWRTRIWIDSWL